MGRRLIRLIAFDLDDTLWPTGQVIGRAIELWYDHLKHVAPALTQRFTLQELGDRQRELVLSDAGLRHDLSAARKLVTAKACEEVGIVSSSDIVESSFDVFASARSQVDDLLFKEVQQTLGELLLLPVLPKDNVTNSDTGDTLGGSEGLVLCGCTNGNAQIERTSLSSYLSFCVRSEDIGVAKPDSKMFLECCRMAAVEPSEVLFVGDNPVDDVEGAHAAGMNTAWINRKGVPWPEEKVRPDAELMSLTDLPRFVASWNEDLCSGAADTTASDDTGTPAHPHTDPKM